jgi:hypothetical protein
MDIDQIYQVKNNMYGIQFDEFVSCKLDARLTLNVQVHLSFQCAPGT